MEIKLVACDVDGTLLFDYAPALPDSTLEVIGRLLDSGITFVPASGRAYDSLCKLFAPFVDRMPFIANNGTVAYLNGEVVYRSIMDRPLGNSLIDAMLENDDVEALVTGALTSYIQPKSPDYPAFMIDELGFDITIVDDLKSIDEPFTKISAYYPSRIVDEAFWSRRFGKDCSIASAGSGWVDMMPTGTSKATALSALLDLLGIQPEYVAAFGDAHNDCEMLKLAGLSIAMETADPRLIQVADRTTSNAEKELERFLLSVHEEAD